MWHSTSRRGRGVSPGALFLRPTTLALAMLAGGCRAVPTLPVRHVVVYRNGIAFFERQGHVVGDRVGFSTRPSGVSDVLATIAVSEAHAAEPAAPAVRSVGLQPRSEDHDGPDTIVLSLDGKPHDIDVGYVAQSPIWKPSYRLMLHAGHDADLQVWGVVENASGEDWKDVGLSLVTGAPVAYASDLDARVIPGRPTITDQGEPTMGIPRGESSYGYRMAENQAMRQASSTESRTSDSAARAGRAARVARAQSQAVSAAADVRTGVGTVTVRGSSTRYDVRLPISIADQSASMVLVADGPVPASQVLLYAPDGTVPDSETHPFRAIRFENRTGGTLEAGPVALFEDGTFLGQAVFDSLPAGASGTVSYAVEHDVTATRESRSGQVTGSLVGGIFGPSLAREQVTHTRYRVRSSLDRAVTVVIKQSRTQGTILKAPPVGTEENASLGTALVPVALEARGSVDVSVAESAPETGPVDWLAPEADLAVKAYLAAPGRPAQVVQALGAAWTLRAQVLKLDEERATARLASYDLERAQQEHRTPDTDAKLAASARRLADLDARYAGLKSQFEHAIGGVKLEP